jgi:SSS family solute:Na+ symporter
MFGITAAAMNPTLADPRLALPWIANQLSPYVGGIFLAALWAADISTAVALLMGCSTLVSEDIVKKIYTKPISEKNEMIMLRVLVLFVSLLSFVLALTARGILATITSALAITTSFTLFVTAAIYFPKLCKKAAGFPIILASLLVWVYWTYITPYTAPYYEKLGLTGILQWPIFKHIVYVEWIICVAIFAVCALICREPAGRLIAENKEA